MRKILTTRGLYRHQMIGMLIFMISWLYTAWACLFILVLQRIWSMNGDFIIKLGFTAMLALMSIYPAVYLWKHTE
jgi:hypothetical protein